MANTKEDVVPPPVSESVDSSSSRDESPPPPAAPDGLTFHRRGQELDDDAAPPGEGIDGFDAARMRDRTLLTAEEEKALMRRVDWRIMTVCSLLFLMKNLDADNISNARIMNRGTGRNIMTELGMSSDQYNLLNVFYYVSSNPSLPLPLPQGKPVLLTCRL